MSFGPKSLYLLGSFVIFVVVVCLFVLFCFLLLIHKRFTQNFLLCLLQGGAAGGICEKGTRFRDGRIKNLNTGVVTFIHYRKKVIPTVSEITFAHETGRNFGSPVGKFLP